MTSKMDSKGIFLLKSRIFINVCLDLLPKNVDEDEENDEDLHEEEEGEGHDEGMKLIYMLDHTPFLTCSHDRK